MKVSSFLIMASDSKKHANQFNEMLHFIKFLTIGERLCWQEIEGGGEKKKGWGVACFISALLISSNFCREGKK